jgi:hypothetical protein
MSREILVFADWEELEKPMLIGILRTDVVKCVRKTISIKTSKP